MNFALTSFYKKSIIIQKMTKIFTILIAFIFYHRSAVKLDHYMTHFMCYTVANPTVMWQHPKIQVTENQELYLKHIGQ
jgi:hypothetical protein